MRTDRARAVPAESDLPPGTWPWLHEVLAVVLVVLFVFGTAMGLARYRQEIRRPVDLPCPVPAPARELVTAGRGAGVR